MSRFTILTCKSMLSILRCETGKTGVCFEDALEVVPRKQINIV